MTIKTRPQLKSYFVKNAIPTEGNFADLIDTQLNQTEDGVFKVAGEPLSVVAAPGAPRRVLRFYSSVPAANPDWLIGLNPAQDPNNPATARLGFGVTDASGVPRLFIDAASGNVGVGTNNPADNKLQVEGNARVSGNLLNTGRIDAQGGVNVTGNVLATGNVGVGTNNPLARLHVEGTTRLNGGVNVLAGGANIVGGLSVAGPVAFAPGASVTFDSPVTARLGLNVTGGALAAQAVTATTVTASGSITASGGITVPAAQAINFDSVLNARLGLTVTGGPTTVGTPQANQSLTVNGGIIGTGALNVAGNINTNGNIGIGGSNSDIRLLVAGTTRVINGVLGAYGGFDVAGGFSANFDSVVNVRAGLNVTGSNVVVGTAQANQSLTVNGAIQATGPLNVVNGGIFANGPNSALMIGTNALVVSAGNTGLGVTDTVGNRLRVAGSARVDGSLTAADVSVTAGGVTLPPFGKRLVTAARGVLLNRANAQHVVLPTIPDTVGFESGFTIQAWIYINSYGDFSRILELGNGISSNNILFFIGIDGSLGAAVFQGGSAGNYWNVRTPSSALPLRDWTHVAITVEPSEGLQGIARFYINGLQIAATGMLMPPKVARATNYIGRSSWGPQDPFFDGSIAELSLWTGPRPIIESPLVGNETGLVAYWKLAENAIDFKTTPLGNGALSGSPPPSFGVSTNLDDWRAPTLGPPWQDYSGGYNPTGYFRDQHGIVHLRGLVRTNAPNSAVAASGRVFTLPCGFRPQFSELLINISDNKIGRIDIAPSGEIYLGLGSTQWFSLDGTTFRAHH